MSRIGATLGGFDLRIIRQMNLINQAINQNTLRLATGKRINSAADDPADLVAVNLHRAELASVQSASVNIQKANLLVDTADAALTELLTNLNTIRTKALEAVGGTLTQAQLDANQAEVDTAIKAINALTATTFGGKRLLDGSQDFILSGLDFSEVRQLSVLDRNTSAASQTISVNVTVAAQGAQLTHTGSGGQIQNDATFSLTGVNGAVTISVSQNELLTDVRDRINQQTSTTGVVASVSGDDLLLTSKDFGNNATAAVQVTSGTFAVTGGNGDGTANGVDAQATINGTAQTADGLKFRHRSQTLDFDLEFDPNFGTGSVNTITVSGNALSFKIDAAHGAPAVLSLPSVHSARLGGVSGRLYEVATGGGKSLLDDPATAVNIADEAISQITLLQARTGAFSKQILDSSLNVLSAQETNLTDSISNIEDADVALETALLVRNQLLADNAAAALAISANHNASILPLLQKIAFG